MPVSEEATAAANSKGALLQEAPDYYRISPEVKALRKSKITLEEFERTNAPRRNYEQVDIPEELRRLDSLVRDMDERTSRSSGEVGRLRTMARLRYKNKEGWKPNFASFKFDEPSTYKPRTKAAREESPYDQMQEQLEKIRISNLGTYRSRLMDYEALQDFMSERERRRKYTAENNLYHMKMDNSRRLIKQQEDLMKNLRRMNEHIKDTDAVATTSRYKV